jgi:hypothetical protein
MRKTAIFMTCFALAGSLLAQSLPLNLTANETLANETVNETLHRAGPAAVNVLTADWTTAIGVFISNAINFLLGHHAIEASVGAALVTVGVLILLRGKVNGFLQALATMASTLILLAILYVLAVAFHVI